MEPVITVYRTPDLPRLLIVALDDADRKALQGRLTPLKSKWSLDITTSGTKALELLAREPHAAVITGSGLSDMGQEEFESRVASDFPKLPRFLLTESTPEIVRPTGKPTTHSICKSAGANEWDSTIRRILLVNTWAVTESVQSLLLHLRKLPVIPKLYQEVVSALQSPDTPFESVAELIAKDPMMTAKMLQVANSTHFALPQPVTSGVEAVMFLGTERVKGLILVQHVFTEFESSRATGLRLDELWKHSLETGACAQAIARWEMQSERHAELAFTAGMLHDVGKLLLAGNLPTEFRCAMDISHDRQMPLHQAERSVFSVSHAEVAGMLLAMWRLPIEMVHAVGWHHAPAESGDKEFSILTAVHAGNVLAHFKTSPGNRSPVIADFDVPYIHQLDVEPHIGEWAHACGIGKDLRHGTP